MSKKKKRPAPGQVSPRRWKNSVRKTLFQMVKWQEKIVARNKIAGWYAAAKAVGARITARGISSTHFCVTRIN